jgi:hypothetical protein
MCSRRGWAARDQADVFSGRSARTGTAHDAAELVDLDLDPRTRRASLNRLVDERLGTDPRLANLRRDVLATLGRGSREANEAGAIRASMLIDTLDGVPVSASMVLTVVPALLGDDGTVLTSAETMADQLGTTLPGGSDGIAVDVVELPAGAAARARWHEEKPVRPSSIQRPGTDHVQYFLPVPTSDRTLVVAFSTPSVRLTDAFTELFAAIAESARWRGPSAMSQEMAP